MTAVDLGPRYRYLRDLGSGGMGRVVLAMDRHLGKEVALKLLHGRLRGREELEQFQREFALLTSVRHPGLARAHDFGYLGDTPYFTSEFVPGEPLAADANGAGPEEIVRHGVEVADALASLHRGGILHLDVKQGNIIVTPGPGTRRPVLIDFGLFRAGLPAGPGAVPRGSLPYMAPEYFQGRPLGPWTDVYAFGVTFYRTITGRYPRSIPRERRGATGVDLEWEPAPLPPSRANGRLPRDLDHVLLKCLALEPGARFSSAAELFDALRRLGPSSARAASALPAPAVVRTVGRESELAVLDAFLSPGTVGEAPADHAPPPVLLLTGPAGIGRSHLFRELKVRSQTRGIPCYLETGYPGGSAARGSLLRSLGPHLDPATRSGWNRFLSGLSRPPRTPPGARPPEESRRRHAAGVALAANGVREPLVLAVDGLEHFDEVSVELLVDLIRFACDKRSERPPIRFAVGYREEGPLKTLLGELSRYLLEQGRSSLLALHPLGPRETEDLYRALRGDSGEADSPASRRPSAIGLFEMTGGVPARIARAAAVGSPLDSHPPEPGGGPKPLRLSREDRLVLVTLALLGRPATATEIARCSGASTRSVARRLASWTGEGPAQVRLVQEDQAASSPGRWLPGPALEPLAAAVSARDRRRIHAAIAAEAFRRIRSGDDLRLLPALRHARAAGQRARVVKFGLPLARRLKSTYQYRAALETLRMVEEAIPAKGTELRLEAALEASDLQARMGRLEEGIDGLRAVLARAPRLPERWRTRIVLRLAMLHTRRGDFRQADELFGRGLAERGRARLGRAEFLFFLNEHAAMKAFVGEYAEACRLCEEGLRLTSRAPGRETQEIVLNLHATRANVHLRNFRFEEAAADFETALGIAEAIGSLANRAVVLNNLGIVYSQCDRYPEAVRAFQEAEKVAREVEEGPSLTFIHGNLALLHAKRGDFAAMDSALAAAGRPGGGAPAAPGSRESTETGRRERMFLEHHRGLSLLHRGRHHEARPHLEEAIRLGGETGDRFVATYDQLYRAEALLFEGAYSEAADELSRLSQPPGPDRVRKMALCRLALLAALTGREDLGRRSISLWSKLAPARPTPFLDAWDDLFLAWALSISGDGDRSTAHLDRCESYFREKGLRPAASLAAWVRAEGCFLRGESESALRLLSASEPRSDLTAGLGPLLRARVLLGGATEPGAKSRAADSLAEAGLAFLGQGLREWEGRLGALRAILHAGGKAGAAERRRVAEERSRWAEEFPAQHRRAFLRSPHWLAWTRGLDVTGRRSGASAGSRRSAGGEPESSPTVATGGGRPPRSRTVALAGSKEGGPGRGDLVARSAAMQELVSTLERLRSSDLPVLIQGETGSGKELVARILHGESRRSRGPFRVLDCAAIPDGLLDAELFGARAGAFTDLSSDRPGLILQASGGTLLVDEIGAASAGLQTRLLRVLSEKTIRAVGSESETPVDARFLVTTAKDLEEEAKRGAFREDLLHRVRVITLRVPPLRKRPEDLEELIAGFLREATGRPPALERGVLDRLRRLAWPGNVRQLKNLILRLGLEHPERIPAAAVERAYRAPSGGPGGEGAAPSTAHLPPQFLEGTLDSLRNRVEREYLLHHLRRLRGDVKALSGFLGLSLKHCYRRLGELGVRLREERRR